MAVEKFGKDYQGREHIEIDGVPFTLQKIVSFEEWLEQRHGLMNEFLKLKPSEREVIFLRWKHGVRDEALEAHESTFKLLLSIYKKADLENTSQATKFYIVKFLRFAEICESVRRRIGLVMFSQEEMPEEAQTAMQVFSGRQI